MDVGVSDEELASGRKVAESRPVYQVMSVAEIDEKVKQLEKAMLDHAQNLEFEQAAQVRDEIAQLRSQQLAS